MEILPLCFKIWSMGGFWRPIDYDSPVSKFCYNCYIFLSFFVLYSLTLFEFVDIALNFGDLNAFADNAFLLLTMMGDCYKAANALIKRAQIIEIQDSLMDEKCTAHNTEEQKILDRFAETCRSNTHNLGILIGTCVIFMLMIPLLYDPNDRMLPIKVWLPYSLSSLTSFYLSYLYQSWALILASIMSTANDTYITGLMIQACAQLDILKYRLNSLHSLPKSENFDRNKDNSFSREEAILKLCIRHHNHIFKFVAAVEQTFSSVVFFQCLVSTTVVCITTFTLSKRDLMSLEFFTTVMYFPAIMFQLLVYCWYGNEVTLKSIEVSNAVSEMDWISLPLSMKKDLVFIILRAGKAITFTSGYILTLSLDSYVAILKLSYSAFNVMQQSSDN